MFAYNQFKFCLSIIDKQNVYIQKQLTLVENNACIWICKPKQYSKIKLIQKVLRCFRSILLLSTMNQFTYFQLHWFFWWLIIPKIVNAYKCNYCTKITVCTFNVVCKSINTVNLCVPVNIFWYKSLHCLQTFIIRNSSQTSTLALSAQFPERSRANVDHYLIQHSDRGFRVQGSLHYFASIFHLLDHYHHWTDELPCPLLLPPTIRRATTLQELTSLSYLGQGQWRTNTKCTHNWKIDSNLSFIYVFISFWINLWSYMGMLFCRFLDIL